jgi:hypothetical protein
MTEPLPQKSDRRLGHYGLWGLGAFLFIALAIWVVYSLATEPLSALRPEIPRLARGLEGPGSGAKEMEAAVDHAKQVMYAKYPGAHFHQWSSRVTDWVGFGLTPMITVVAGVLGRSLRPGEDRIAAVKEAVGTDSTQSSRRWVMTVGIGAALASVMIGLSSKLQAESQRAMDQGEKVRALISTSQKEYFGAATPEAALQVANNLDAETRNNE